MSEIAWKITYINASKKIRKPAISLSWQAFLLLKDDFLSLKKKKNLL